MAVRMFRMFRWLWVLGRLLDLRRLVRRPVSDLVGLVRRTCPRRGIGAVHVAADGRARDVVGIAGPGDLRPARRHIAGRWRVGIAHTLGRRRRRRGLRMEDDDDRRAGRGRRRDRGRAGRGLGRWCRESARLRRTGCARFTRGTRFGGGRGTRRGWGRAGLAGRARRRRRNRAGRWLGRGGRCEPDPRSRPLRDRRRGRQTADPDAQGDRRENQVDDPEREHEPKSLGGRHRRSEPPLETTGQAQRPRARMVPPDTLQPGSARAVAVSPGRSPRWVRSALVRRR